MKKTIIATAIAAATFAPGAVLAKQAPTPAPAETSAQSSPAQAPAAATAPTVGAKVYDPTGAEVGTVEAVQGDIVTVTTGTARAGLPSSAFVTRAKGLTISMNKAQLEAAVSGATAGNSAARDAALVADAPIKSSDGVVLGTVTKVEGDNVTVALSNGSAATLKKSYIGLGTDKSLAVGMTAADFAKATQAAGTAQAGTEAGAAPEGETAATPTQGSGE